jgi:hypothetical protein
MPPWMLRLPFRLFHHHISPPKQNINRTFSHSQAPLTLIQCFGLLETNRSFSNFREKIELNHIFLRFSDDQVAFFQIKSEKAVQILKVSLKILVLKVVATQQSKLRFIITRKFLCLDFKIVSFISIFGGFSDRVAFRGDLKLKFLAQRE